MSKIQWTNETWNPIVGCSKISEGCKNCYAEKAAQAPRLQQYKQYQEVKAWNKTTFVESQIDKPKHWKKPRTIFVCSMGDLFHETVEDEWIERVFKVMRACPQHTFQVLTKRPDRMKEFVCRHTYDEGRYYYDSNIWLGTSVENQRVAKERIPQLLQIPAKVLFLSCEPLLEPLDLSEWLLPDLGFGTCDVCEHEHDHLYGDPQYLFSDEEGICENCRFRINWMIVGGESCDRKSEARLCHTDWIESLMRQGKAANVPVFVKQLGSNSNVKTKNRKGGDIDEFPVNLQTREFPNV